jgi:hypothetical protein
VRSTVAQVRCDRGERDYRRGVGALLMLVRDDG